VTDWIVFFGVIMLALAVDFIVSRKTGERRAGRWSAVWIGLGVAFGAWIGLRHGGEAGVTYLTAYLDARPVPRLHLQRLRHPGPALALLRAGRRDG
jgi:hypothetical protein